MTSVEANSQIGDGWQRFIDEIIAPTGVPPEIIHAFTQVDRARFVAEEFRESAYTDAIIPVAEGATVSQPSFVALMLGHLRLTGEEKVLEIGTATGYQAALLSHLAREIHTIEINENLTDLAKANLDGVANVSVHNGDGAVGILEHAPYDAIIVTAGLRGIPPALQEQLAVGGRLLAPIGDLPEVARLTRVTRSSETIYESQDLGSCQFVPLYSQEDGAWTNESLSEARKISRTQKREQHRAALREAIIADAGEDGLQETLEELGGQLSEIMGQDLSEEQVLDMLAFTLNLRRRTDEAEDEIETHESELNLLEVSPEVIMGSTTDAHPLDVAASYFHGRKEN